MNYIDIILGVLLIIAAVRGFIKGFVVEVASLAALILGIWGAIHFSYFTADFLTGTFNWDTEHIGLIAFFITFVLILVVVHILGNVLTSLVEAMALGLLNHLAGLLFGVLKTALILSIVLVFFDRIDEDAHIISKDTKEESRVYEPLKNLVPTLLPFLNFWDDQDQPNKSKLKDEIHKVV
ncbi:CvpA family protein [Mangrovibacterium lignilyticum]|uniref:CvpA family protein n=1 Tax=Mangrovibacterium lignilyticum TaxID=2668052 RepID=UPI0013D2B44C|nr:CvpA family protein [Mangrovibacterium lignilyticum]